MVGLLSPALILYFLLRVTGIPATEEQALRSRGEEYRRYQRTTARLCRGFRAGRKGALREAVVNDIARRRWALSAAVTGAGNDEPLRSDCGARSVPIT